ncbi:hypothetical protein BN1723_009301 [Verticillium longisporum]|uniref:Centromere protein H C-terminal domain-containing protein n=1 Tax=Verticillium longisporum TaxID=100787 RepID=A0A0G4KMZ3_VERLO|nr:hypothetical protein BN1723_009301 [Verticillium longisporum]CRK35334.1 hypothetical protein BN1708_006690 [Verticillium longisporum]
MITAEPGGLVTMEANSSSPDAPSSELPPLRLSPDEQQVLTLYDQLRDLELKVALLKAQTAYIPDTAPAAETSLEEAQSAASAAKATYLLRNTITDAVLTANPILQAVHSSTRATPIESDLLPSVRARDAASATLARNATSLRDTLDALAATRAEALAAGRRNAELAQEVLRLAEEAARRRGGGSGPEGSGGEDDETRRETQLLRARLKASRQKWKVMKGTASAIVVGSGVDWVGDEGLRWMVLDPEGEEL